MPRVILVAVSDGFGGYGDFLFALKLAEQIKKYYTDLLSTDEIPEVKLITQVTGQKKIENLQGDTEFGVEVLTPDELKEKISNKELEVASIIECPVFCHTLIRAINTALKAQTHLASLIMMPEYGYSSPTNRSTIEDHSYYRKLCFDKIVYMETIYTGFNAKENERGIILSDNLVNPEKPSILRLKLEEKIREALFREKNVETYQDDTDMYFQYSHDTYPTKPKMSAAERFLKTHRIYSKSSKKNQDVLMVGKAEDTKRDALEKVKTQLIADGFSKISFYNADTNTEEYLVGNPITDGRHYRVIYSSSISHESMIAAQALAADLVGATGDQSFGEAVSAEKILVYECLSHKQVLINEYYKRLTKIDPACAEILNLLRNAESESDYRCMERLLTEEMKVKLKKLSKLFRESGELIKFAVHAAMPIELLSQQMIRGDIDPYDSNSDSISSFEKTLMLGHFDVFNHVMENHISTPDDRRKFCEILTKKNHKGTTQISALRTAKPGSTEASRASYLVIQFNINKYKAPPGSMRETMFNAYKELISTFTALGEGQHDDDALIGLMLLTTKNISNEYRFFSPRKGLLFGSRFYSSLEDSLNNLGINIKEITLKDRKGYYDALAHFMERNPHLIANEYILDSLSSQANIILPKIPPLLSDMKAKELLFEKPNKTDPTIFRAKEGLYKIHPVPLGQGGWGSVHAARHYTYTDHGINVSSPLAIKMMSNRHELVMDKEEHMFKKVYPDEHFERFNKGHQACLSMPLFPGVPLDDYLNNHLELNIETRKEIVVSLLENLQKIHGANVTHNDLKPKNILYDPVLKKIHIIDFGCAEDLGTNLKYTDFDTSVFAFEIPLEYMSGAKANPQMDIFSLTAVIAEILGANKKEFARRRLDCALGRVLN